MPVQTTFHHRTFPFISMNHPARTILMRRYCPSQFWIVMSIFILFYVGWYISKFDLGTSPYKPYSAAVLAYQLALNNSLPIIHNPQICSLDEVDILFVIISSTSHFHERQSIRDSWTSMPDLFNIHSQRLFIIGYQEDDQFYQDLIDEAAHERDILYLTVNDHSTTLKELDAYRWIEKYCGYVVFTFKTEDDLFVNSLLLHELIRQLKHKPHQSQDRFLYQIQLDALFHTRQNVEKPKFLFGWAFQAGPPERNNSLSPYYVSQDEYSKPVYPRYCSGFGYLMDSKTRNLLVAEASKDQKPFRFADIFITGILPERLNFVCDPLPFTYYQGTTDDCKILIQKTNRKDPLPNSTAPLIVCSTGRHVAEESFNDYHLMWAVLKQTYADRIQTLEG